MLIRNQNKENLFNIDAIDGIGIIDSYSKYIPFAAVNGREYILGEYSTKEKVIKVLDMIQEQYQYIQEFKYIGVGCSQPEFIFKMPQDDEVEGWNEEK